MDIRKRYFTGSHVVVGVDDTREMSNIYGAEHLLRMIVALPGMVAQSSLDPDSVAIVRDYVNELLLCVYSLSWRLSHTNTQLGIC